MPSLPTSRPLTPVAAAILLLAVAAGGVTAFVLVHRGNPAPVPGSTTSPSAPPAVVAEVATTVAARTAHVRIVVTPTPALAAALGAAGATLTGQGDVDFASRRASWTLALPDNLGGGRVAFVADGAGTYVRLPQTGGRWIALTTDDDYAAFDQVPLVRDLAVLSNPMRSLDLVDSMQTASANVASSSMAVRAAAQAGDPGLLKSAPRVAGASQSPSASPPPSSGGCAASQVSGTLSPSQLYDLFSVNVDAQGGVVRAWATNQVSARGAHGVCQARVSVSNSTGSGFDVRLDFSDPGGEVVVAVPGGHELVDYSVIAHVTEEPCWWGTWDGRSEVTIPGGDTLPMLAGGGTVRLELSPAGATLTSSEAFHGNLMVDQPRLVTGPDGSVVTEVVPAPYPVTFTRDVDAQGGPALVPPVGAAETSTLTVFVSGTAFETETGSPTGQRSDNPSASWTLTGPVQCDPASPQLTLRSNTFGTMVMTRTSPTYPPSVSGSRLVTNWRNVPDLPSPSPSARPSATAQPSPAPTVAVTGFGTDDATWRAHHVADPAAADGFDPMPGRFPGAPLADEFVGVMVTNGRIAAYFQQFGPQTSETSAAAAVLAMLPTDTAVVDPPTSVGRCAAEELQSPSLAAALGTAGLVSVTYDSAYGGASGSYSATDVREAYVQVDSATAPPSFPPNSAVCG